ncbi:MAG: hypothetical protein JXA14_13350 [Anaerolineae bacterium]|nr:hypothetical protein [Anaerolineae bacterium]
MSRCLILSCSQAKRGDDGPLPALERYNGPTFRVVRRFLADADPVLQDVDIYVLSAQYGLIAAAEHIANYDQRMTQARADELRPRVLAQMQELLNQGYIEVFFSLGRSYLQALNGFEDWVPNGTRVIVSQATVGRRLTELKRWLYRLPAGTLAAEQPKRQVRITGRAILKGQQIEATPEDVLALARRARAEGRGDPHNFHDWYALVDGERVSPKWLVSLLSGLAVSEFQASEARRVLGQLGVAVYHDE